MTKVYMVQKSKNRWHIESKSGNIIQDDITVSSVKEAEIYIANYVSSFRAWTYELKPMRKK